MAETSDKIVENVQGPKSVTVDGRTVTQHSPREQIEADRYAKSNSATSKKLGFRRVVGRNPGAA